MAYSLVVVAYRLAAVAYLAAEVAYPLVVVACLAAVVEPSACHQTFACVPEYSFRNQRAREQARPAVRPNRRR